MNANVAEINEYLLLRVNNSDTNYTFQRTHLITHLLGWCTSTHTNIRPLARNQPPTA